jgi:phosphate transport system permease protein
VRDHRDLIAGNKRLDRLFKWAGLGAMAFAVVILLLLLGTLVLEGGRRIDWQFLTSYPSRAPERAGILPACVGTVLVMLVTALASIPLGVAAAVYLEEYAPKNRLTAIIEINIANLAGVPSIVYGLMALGLFVYQLQLGHSILTAGLTLALLCLPVVIIATREALRTVPVTIREAAYALGATKWQTIRDHVLPYSTGGILTGVIIALSRAIGETAPLITIGALSFVAFLPSPPITAEPPFLSVRWLFDPFTVLPMQIFNWVSRPQEAFHLNAAGAGLVLMSVTLVMNGLAYVVRYRSRRRIQW